MRFRSPLSPLSLVSLPTQLAAYAVGVAPFLPLLAVLIGRHTFLRLRKSLVPVYVLAAYAIWYATCLVLVQIVPRQGFIGRVDAIATLFNVAVLLTTCFFAGVGRSMAAEVVARQLVSRMHFLIFFFSFVLLYLYVFVAGPPYNLSFSSVLGLFITVDSGSILGSIDSASIFRHDWLQFAMPRLTIIERYPAATALIVIGFASAALLQCSGRSERVLFEGILIVLVATSLTRSIWAGYAIALSICLGILALRRSRLLLAAGVIVLVIAVTPIDYDGLMTWMANSREGSTDARLALYLSGVHIGDLGQLLFGNGGKVYVAGDEGLKFGSHSSPIGSFYKGGVTLFLLYAVFFATLAWSAVAAVARPNSTYTDFVLARFVLTFLVWSIFEDFDASPVVAAVSGVMIGILARRTEAKQPAAATSSPQPSRSTTSLSASRLS